MGGTDHLRAALDIFTRLHTRVATGQVSTPCGDKDIELTMGRLLQVMGGKENLRAALDIFIQMRTRAAGQVHTPCDDRDIELAWADIFSSWGARTT
ncbi:hypothetical protein E1189_14875 [Sansalvadorimonas verongulae]|nr:hypothetical protein [Sansalvadorimonas verongulae]